MANGDKIETEKELVRGGFAWRFVRCDKAREFTAAEREARELRRGSWADPHAVPPCEYQRVLRRPAKRHSPRHGDSEDWHG